MSGWFTHVAAGRGLSSLPGGLALGLCECPHSTVAGLPWPAGDPREAKQKPRVSCDLVSEGTCCRFCVLLITSTNPD